MRAIWMIVNRGRGRVLAHTNRPIDRPTDQPYVDPVKRLKGIRALCHTEYGSTVFKQLLLGRKSVLFGPTFTKFTLFPRHQFFSFRWFNHLQTKNWRLTTQLCSVAPWTIKDNARSLRKHKFYIGGNCQSVYSIRVDENSTLWSPN